MTELESFIGRTIVAYGLVLLLAPLVGTVMFYVAFPFVVGVTSRFKGRAATFFGFGLGSFAMTFGTVWIGTIICSWFKKDPTWLMVVILAIGFLAMWCVAVRDEWKNPPEPKAEKEKLADEHVSTGVGELLGLVVGGRVFL